MTNDNIKYDEFYISIQSSLYNCEKHLNVGNHYNRTFIFIVYTDKQYQFHSLSAYLCESSTSSCVLGFYFHRLSCNLFVLLRRA